MQTAWYPKAQGAASMYKLFPGQERHVVVDSSQIFSWSHAQQRRRKKDSVNTVKLCWAAHLRRRSWWWC